MGISQKIHLSDHEHNHYQAVSKAPSHGMETGWYGMPEITFLYLDRPGGFPQIPIVHVQIPEQFFHGEIEVRGANIHYRLLRAANL